MRVYPLAIACTVATLAAPVMAQDNSDTNKASQTFDLGQIIVQGQVSTAPTVGSDTLGQDAIEAFNRNTLDDAANLLPGVAASNSGGSRNERLLFVRGFDRFQVPLSIDGIRVYLPADNRLDYGRFLTPDIAEIQVAKGYASVLDGPGAMGGAVNLVTRKPAQPLEAELRGTLDLDSDADYAGYTAFGLLGTRQDKWYAQASFARSFQDHWDLPDSFTPTASEDGGARDLSRTEDWRLNVKAGFTPNATDEYSLSYTRQEGEKNAPLSTVDPANIQKNWSWPWWNIDSIYFLSRTQLADGVTLKTRAFRNGFDNLLSAWDDATETSQTLRRAFNSYYEDSAWGGSAELAFALRETDRLSMALHYRSDKHVEYNVSPITGTEPPQTDTEDTWSAALEYQGALSPTLTATLGTSYDWRNLKRAEEFGETPTSNGASVLFSYPIRDSDAWNLQGRVDWRPTDSASKFYVSVSSRARFPTIAERFSSRFGGAVSSPDLKSERATNYEVGGETALGAAHLTGAVFYSHLNDTIVAFPLIYQNTPVTQSRNLGHGNYYGFELSVDAKIAPTLTAGANYTYTHRDLDDPTNAAFRPTGVPAHKAFVYAEWQPLARLHVQPSLDIASNRWTTNTAGTAYFRTGSYADASLRVDYDITNHMMIGAGVRNAFDDLYYLTDGFPEAGRRYFLTARWRS